MKPTLFIHCQVGIGDGFMINGLVRHYVERYTVTLGTSWLNSKNIKYLFRDLTELKFFTTVIESDAVCAKQQIYEHYNNGMYDKVLKVGYLKQIGSRPWDKIGHELLRPYNWVKSIYEDDGGIPVSTMYSKFFAERDLAREEEFYNRVIEKLGTTDYVIITNGNVKLNTNEIPEKYKTICIDRGKFEIESDIVMDYCTLIERSKAYHGPDTGWSWMVEMLDLKVPKRYMHNYPPCNRFDSENFPEDYFKSGKWTVLRNLTNEKLAPVNNQNSELLDRLSILEIKKERIQDPEKLGYIEEEYDRLAQLTTERSTELKNVNTILWNIEDEIRLKEKKLEFDSEFIWLARCVYKWNDRRNELKNEQKSYAAYKNKKPDLFILAPTGFGDALVINGLVREFAERYNIILGIEYPYKKNIPYMFRDLPNISYAMTDEKNNENGLKQLARFSHTLKCEKLYLGYTNQLKDGLIPMRYVGFRPLDPRKWISMMYADANLNLDIMFKKFYVLRDRWREEEFYKKVIEHLGTTEYIVVHDCCNRGKIDRKKIPENTNEVFLLGKGASPIESDCIFDYRLVIERAQAYHGPDGGFSWLVEMCKINVPKKYIHMYPPLGRTDPLTFPNGYYRSEWNVLR